MGITINKTCSCGVVYVDLPESAELKDGIYWFQCSCKSTLTHMPEFTKRRLERQEKLQREERVKEERHRQNEWVKNTHGLKTRQPE